MKHETVLYIDCDTGVDDALAITYLSALSHIRIVGVGTVSGNIDAETAAINSANLLEMLGLTDVPVAVGDRDWLATPFDGGAPEVHGANGIGNVELPNAQREPSAESAVDLLLRLSHEHVGELSVLALGPLTNLARALEIDPEVAGRVKALTVMGGAALAPGNVSAVAEANFIKDPEAARKVLESGWNMTIAPLDVTMKQRLTRSHLARLADSGHPAGSALARMFDHYFMCYVGTFDDESAMHDPTAAALAAGRVKAKAAPAVVVTVDDSDGPGRGQLIADLRGMYAGFPDQEGATCKVALELEDDAVEEVIGTVEAWAKG